MPKSISNNLLTSMAATEYTMFDHPEYTVNTEYGRFVHIPQFPERNDAHQIFNCSLRSKDIDDFIRYADKLFKENELDYIKFTGHCQETYQRLIDAGYSPAREWMMLKVNSSCKKSNPDLRIEVVEPDSERELELDKACPELKRCSYYKFSDSHLEGKLVYAYLNNKLAGSTGWYFAGDYARFRFVQTLPEFRRQGVATTMIHHIQNHPDVKAKKGLVIFCDDAETIKLYESLGFVKQGFIWSVRWEI